MRASVVFALALVAGCETATLADAGALDARELDASALDASGLDASTPDAGRADASGPDVGEPVPDGGTDPGALDAGPPVDPIDGVGAASLVQGGFMFTEGPQWLPDTGELVFSDIDADTIFVLRPGGTIEPFRRPSGRSNGLELDVDGSLLAAEHGGRRVARGDYDMAPTTVVDAFEGASFHSPNDLIVRSDGTLYFTDPPYGLAGRPRELDFVGVFRLTPSGALVVEDRGALDMRPNGIDLSPDERVLYVADSMHGFVRAFDVAADGSLSNERRFVASVPGADGMTVDEAGNLYVAASDGIRVYAPTGDLWGTIPIPRQPTNCAFGGPELTTLFVTARDRLYRIDGVRVRGRL